MLLSIPMSWKGATLRPDTIANGYDHTQIINLC